MKPSEALNKNRVLIRQIVASHHASNARVFGSVVSVCRAAGFGGHGADTREDWRAD